MLYLGLIVIAGGILFVNYNAARRNADVVGLRNARASKVAKRRLKTAEKYLKEQNADKFYEEMLRALWGYLSDKLSIPTSQLTRQNIAATLGDKGYGKEAIDPVIAIIDDCEMARYTPESSSRMDTVYTAGVEAINNIERNSK